MQSALSTGLLVFLALVAVSAVYGYAVILRQQWRKGRR